MVVKVYGSAKAACPQRVLACLIEQGVEFELVHVNLDHGEHKRHEFLLQQPFGQVPVVEDGDFKLYESRAIVRYYAAKNTDPGPDLLGATLEERALVDQWLEVEAHNFNDLCFTLILQLVILPKMDQRGDLALAQSCEQILEKVLDVYEQRKHLSCWRQVQFGTSEPPSRDQISDRGSQNGPPGQREEEGECMVGKHFK